MTSIDTPQAQTSAFRIILTFVTVLLAVVSMAIEFVIDMAFWFDISAIPYKGSGISLLRGLILILMICALAFRDKIPAFILAAAGFAFYLFVYII